MHGVGSVFHNHGYKEVEIMEKYKDIYGVLTLNRFNKAPVESVSPDDFKIRHPFKHQEKSVDFKLNRNLTYNPYDSLFQTYWETFFNDPNNYLL